MSPLHTSPSSVESTKPSDPFESWIEPVRHALQGIKFGSIVIIVQDGKIVQIDRTEKLRLDKSSS
jgi:hypothetical protein